MDMWTHAQANADNDIESVKCKCNIRICHHEDSATWTLMHGISPVTRKWIQKFYPAKTGNDIEVSGLNHAVLLK